MTNHLSALPLILAAVLAGADSIAGPALGAEAGSAPISMAKARDGLRGKGVVTVNNQKVELRTPDFVLRLDAGDGLRAESWENRLTGTTIALGHGPELGLDIGATVPSAVPVKLRVTGLPDPVQAPAGKAVFTLAAEGAKITARVTYQWDAAQPVLRKFVEIVNAGDRPLNRLLNMHLGAYQTDASKVTAKGLGFPVYLNDEFFLSLAHPSGRVGSQGKEVFLRHHPGKRIAPGETFAAMETVYGVAKTGGAQQAFTTHLTQRMRRVVRKHDKPYAIFDAFGWDPLWETEAYLLDNISKVAKGQEESGCHFDYYSVDFWNDPAGDLVRFHPQNFPNGFAPIKQALEKLGTAPGLWIDSGGSPGWTIGGNPAIKPAMTDPSGRGSICRAAEPARSLYTKAFIHHVKENGVRLLKFDHNGNKEMVCNNPHHDHLPGAYSTEANHEAIIEFLQALDRECPEVFLMLYWGYSSPWWLLHADTIFDCGLHIEARDPASQPTPYARDTVIQRMDQGLRSAVAQRDIPALGKDSLGVWLARSTWNSSIGKERWQESLVMDICRGSLLAQIWTDRDWLTPPERKQMADFIALVKTQPNCFRNSRWILGDPWKDEPYGYSCTDGKRAFLAINNACWRDSSIAIRLGSEWGLPDGGSWDIYRWHPDPSRLVGARPAFGQSATIALRPFEVVLLEVVPAGQAPSLARQWRQSPMPVGFAEPTTVIDFTKVADDPDPALRKPTNRKWAGQIPPAAKGGTLVVVSPGATIGALAAQLGGQPAVCTPVWGASHVRASWKAWRIAVGPSSKSQEIVLDFSDHRGPAVSGFFIPLEQCNPPPPPRRPVQPAGITRPASGHGLCRYALPLEGADGSRPEGCAAGHGRPHPDPRAVQRAEVGHTDAGWRELHTPARCVHQL